MKMFIPFLLALALGNLALAADEPGFKNGYPDNDTIQQVRNDQVFQRAVQAYRFWYPTVSAEGIFNGARKIGMKDNVKALYTLASPASPGFTPNVDTPYAVAVLDLKDGPMVIEVPAGPYIGLVDDHHQRWIQDIGLPGPDAGKGGKHLILPPGYKEEEPAGYYVGRAQSYKLLLALRAMPVKGDMKGAMDLLTKVKIYPYSTSANPKLVTMVDANKMVSDFTPLKWEDNIEYWKQLHKIIQDEPAVEEFSAMYGTLAAIGIEKNKLFAPDNRMQSVLEQAAKEGRRQMLVAAYASWRPDRMVWKDRKWEWAGLISENANFETRAGVDLEARDRWFTQAIVTSPAMFKRKEGAGSLYWLGLRDDKEQFLDGGKTYKLTVPMPVPAKLFWSVTVYDNQTRSLIQTDQNRAALRSLFELKNASGKMTELYFGPKAPAGKEAQWIKTTPGKGWFAYFRIYGPEKAAFEGKWKPGDFEEVMTEKTAQNK